MYCLNNDLVFVSYCNIVKMAHTIGNIHLGNIKTLLHAVDDRIIILKVKIQTKS